VIVLGTDCPALTRAHLQESAAALADGLDAALVPAEDGGYVVIGLARARPSVFDGVSWGTRRVLAETRDRLRAAGLHWFEGPLLWDVDRPADLARLATLGVIPAESD
jgi:glycosyltransferase A (GT-A) superfamily protein (DUF2064 family)